MKKNSIEQYLSKYSHAIKEIQIPADYHWQEVLILPICGEDTSCVQRLLQHQSNQKFLLIIVINRPESHIKSELWKGYNIKLIKYLSHKYQVSYQWKAHTLFYAGQHSLLLLNFNDQPFMKKQGVGLARKIAADTALMLTYQNRIKSQWIHSTDADTILPIDYFQASQKARKAVALSFPFVHVARNQLMQRLQTIYDLKLKYYQWGMQQIGVAYNYIPLGSALAFNASAYAQVRGFPLKNAGEDFYLLNKLAKIGQVVQPEMSPILIDSRFSDRVPFGTGPALKKYHDNNEEALYYNPEIFFIVKRWRNTLLSQYTNSHVFDETDEDRQRLNDFWSWTEVFRKNRTQIKSEQRWQQFIHEWLDAFKLLKSVHHLRQWYPDVRQNQIPFL